MSYWAIRLTTESKGKILALLSHSGYDIPEGWYVKCDHITLAHSANVEFNEWIRLGSVLSNFQGAKVRFTIKDFAFNDAVMAVGVDANSLNEHPHITIAVAPGHYPVESNDIEYSDWIDVLCLETFEGFLVKLE